MDILSVISQEVKSIFSEVVNDVSVPAETLEVEVLRASRELGRKVLEAFDRRSHLLNVFLFSS